MTTVQLNELPPHKLDLYNRVSSYINYFSKLYAKSQPELDIAIPGDCRIKQKVIEKKEKYTDLCIRIQQMWSSAAIVVPVVIGALGSVSRDLEESLVLISLEEWTIPILQKTVLLNTVHILRHFLTH